MNLIRVAFGCFIALVFYVGLILFLTDLRYPSKVEIVMMFISTIMLYVMFSLLEFHKYKMEKIKRETDRLLTLKNFSRTCKVCHESTRIDEWHPTDREVLCNDCRVKAFSSLKKVIGFTRE